MISRLIEFTEALRKSKIPVALLESIDASNALSVCDVSDREQFRSFLSSTLVKDHAHQQVFDKLFEVYFSLGTYESNVEEDLEDAYEQGGYAQFEDASSEELRELIAESVLDGNDHRLLGLIANAVGKFAGIEPGRPVGGVYYSFKTLRQLDISQIRALLLDARIEQLEAGDALGRKLVSHEIDAALDKIRKMIDDDIRRRIVADRGPNAVARTMRATLPEDIEFMHASTEELHEIASALGLLVRKLASRLGYRRRKGRHGSLDFRRTIRNSIANGGVPVDLFYHKPVPTKPELVVVADVSGSVASFARFTLSMLYALSEQFSKLRSFVFIDEVDEVTEIFDTSDDFESAMSRVSTRARVVWTDGHSDYGRVMENFVDRWGDGINHRTSVIFLGDARNNYHPARSEALASIRMKARAVYWLNPEPSAYWDRGDSIMSQYRLYCDSVDECRNLRQLRAFVERLL